MHVTCWTAPLLGQYAAATPGTPTAHRTFPQPQQTFCNIEGLQKEPWRQQQLPLYIRVLLIVPETLGTSGHHGVVNIESSTNNSHTSTIISQLPFFTTPPKHYKPLQHPSFQYLFCTNSTCRRRRHPPIAQRHQHFPASHPHATAIVNPLQLNMSSTPGSKTEAASSSQAQAASGSQAQEKDAGPSQQSPQTSGSGSGAQPQMGGHTAFSYIEALLHRMYQRTGWTEAALATTIAKEAVLSTNKLETLKMYEEQILIHRLLDVLVHLNHRKQDAGEVARIFAKVVRQRENENDLYLPPAGFMADVCNRAREFTNNTRSSLEAAKNAALPQLQLGVPQIFSFPGNYSFDGYKFYDKFNKSESAYNYILVPTNPDGKWLSMKLRGILDHVPNGPALIKSMVDSYPGPGPGTCKVLSHPGNPALGSVTVVLLFAEADTELQHTHHSGYDYRANLRKSLAHFR